MREQLGNLVLDELIAVNRQHWQCLYSASQVALFGEGAQIRRVMTRVKYSLNGTAWKQQPL